jgi:hypothetical protein
MLVEYKIQSTGLRCCVYISSITSGKSAGLDHAVRKISQNATSNYYDKALSVQTKMFPYIQLSGWRVLMLILSLINTLLGTSHNLK